MALESIGQLGSYKWAHEFAIWYIPQVVGDPPAGCKLTLWWHDHELGSYSTIALLSESSDFSEAALDYIGQCQEVIDALEEEEIVDLDRLDPGCMRDLLKDRK